MAELVELLFFDTFAHENSEELNLDLVQFPKPVYVTEVRIIPLGARVQADFPGGVRLGATNPSQFQIEFFVNDLGKPGASTFETLGGFEYNQNGCINLVCVHDETIRKIPTDGLVLRGWYTTITLAVYGTLTANIAEQIIPPVVTPSLPAQANTISDVQQIISQNNIENEWQEPIQPVVPIEYSQQPATQYPQPYVQQDTYPQDNYGEYYNEVPKDPRSYHHTPETDWESKSRGRSIERDRDRDRGRDNTYQKSDLDHDHNDRRERDRRYSRSHSRDKTSRDYRETSRDKEQDRDWEQPNYRENDKDWDRDRDRDRYKHSDNYRRYSDREERKRPRTPPPMPSPKRPHTPHSDHKEASPKVSESVLEEDRLQKVDNKKEVEKVTVEETATMDVEEFEPILSDEDILDDTESFQDVDYDYAGYTNNDDLIKLFVPGQSMIKQPDIEALYSIVNRKLIVSKQLKIIIDIADDFFKSSITKYTLADFDKLNAEFKEEFIHLCERVTHIFDNSKTFCIIAKIFFEEIDDCEMFSQIEFIMQTLESWLKIALDFEMANAQDQPAYKIRHIKCGVKLAEWCSESTHFLQLLWRADFYIHDVLFSLYEREYMALSIKLMILKALDAYLLNKKAVEVFLCGSFNTYEVYTFTKSDNYKMLVGMIDKNPSVRLKFALNSILMKLNSIEALYKFQTIIKKVIADENYNYNEEELKFLTETLEYFLNLIEIGPFIFSQPKRFLPVVSQFEINRSDNKNSLIEIFQMQNIYGLFLILLMHSSTMTSPNIKTTIYEILANLTKTQQGLKYLLKNIDMTNTLIKILLHNEDVFTLESEIKSHNLGLEIAYKLQTLYHIETLKGLKHKNDCESSDVIDQLHALFCITFSNIGKLCVGKVLGFENNIECLLNLVDLKNESKLRKSPAIGYIIDLLVLAVICVPNIPFLEAYSKQLLEIVNQSEMFESNRVKLTELEGYLKPYEGFKGNYEVAELIETIGRNSAVNFSGVLITSLRILKHIGISKYAGKACAENPLNNFNELKYKHVILQLFPLDGVGILSKILLDLCEFYEQPSLHSASLISNQGILVVNIISPCVKLLKQMLTNVIQCRNTQFKDLTTVPVLLQTYNLCQSFPINSLGYYKAKKLCKEIVDTLLVYTQPVSEEIHEKDSLNKTLWTLMCGEILKFTISAPHTFIAGLSVFSEMLPLPLPIQTQNDLNPEEVSWAINLRKLWSAHLHSHSNNIPDLITKLCTTTYQPLLNLLRKICAQISDLAANSALMIARGILDNVHTAIVISDDAKKLVCNGYIARLMNFLACLVTHNSLKCTFLYLLSNSSGGKGDEKYPAIIQAFAQVLRSTSNLNSHVQTQECILSIIQSFCDTEITLYQDSSSEIYLSNALPNKEHLLVFLNTMLDHISAENSFLTYLPVVRTLLLLTEHDYGFYHLKECLLKKNVPFKNILTKLETSFSKDNADCLSTMNTLMEFLRVCSEPEEVVGIVDQPRTMRMTVSEIQSLLAWKKEEGEDNPLGKLEEKLKAVIQEDSAFEALLESLQVTINFLNTKVENELKENYVEPQLPPPDPLLVQFAGRSIYTTRTEVVNERLTASYWLNSLGGEDTDGSCDPENVNCDLAEICRQDLSSDVNLVKQIEKLCRVCPLESTEQVEKEKRINAQKDKMKRPFVTPVRGRGFARTIQVRSDLFRSRPPNTSRPPSLHVDDFVALETCGAQPTGPTGYNRISRELLATSRVTRGPRGRAFVASERAVQYRQMSWWGHGPGRAPY